MRNILNWYQSGGPFVVPLILAGVAGLAVLIERFISIVLRSRINARPFIERVISLVRADKVDEALQLCADHESALPDLGLILLRSRSRDERELMNIARAAMFTVTPVLTRRLSWLPALAAVALLLGVLGFITNLHATLTEGAAPAMSRALADALQPAGIGVLTAIPCVLGHTYLTHEAMKTIARLEEFSARLVNALMGRPDVRLGHR
jgi:biopolymer transport protein ExbB/TolQ